MAQNFRRGDQINNSPIIIVAPNPGQPERSKGPGPWASFAAGVILALVVVVTLALVAGDPASAQTLGAFVRALLQAP